jgi:MYXO-CTERM domain-containing protein
MLRSAREHGLDVAAIDGRAPGYAVGQSVRMRIGNANATVPVGGVGAIHPFNVPDGGDGQAQDGGAPLLGGYVVQQGAIKCSGAIGPLDRATFTRAVQSPQCTAVLAAEDERWAQRRGRWGGEGCACAVPAGAPATSGTLGILLALLAFRRRRRARR